jgi:hypothetical protein
MELGVYTFAELSPDPATGRAVDAGRRLRDLVEEMELAGQVGLCSAPRSRPSCTRRSRAGAPPTPHEATKTRPHTDRVTPMA